jgi:hypothetical protein
MTGVGLLALASQTVTAGTATCPPGAGSTDSQIGVTLTDPANPTCFAYGDGSQPIVPAGYTVLDKSDDTETGVGTGTEGALTGTSNGSTLDLTSGTSGTFSIDQSLVEGWTNLLVVFKRGNANPDWAAFTLDGLFAGGWFMVPDGSLELSNAQLWGSPVPLPAAAWLFGSALLGMAGIGYRRRQTA